MSAIRSVISTLDFALRLAFFAVAPFCLAFVALLFPVSGALVQIGLALLFFVAGQVGHDLGARSRIAAWLLSSQFEFEAYYREHPPRPFLYYVCYPLLFPYWLLVRDARREFLLFKGYTLASFALLLVSLGIGYWSAFRPELGLRQFVPIALGSLAVEAAVVLMLLMPLATTVVHYHSNKAGFRLAALFIAAGVSLTGAVTWLERRHDPVVSFATRSRVRSRTAACPSGARDAQLAALQVASQALRGNKDDVDSDGKVEGEPLDRAHAALARFYKVDEAAAFDLWLSRVRRRSTLVVYFEARRGNAPIWLAVDQKGKVVEDARQLPSGAFAAMKHAAIGTQ